ncbi:conserved protein, unknown function, partial [Hepatocystis sp. ex Piliocolobus tephrosceles]
MTKLHSLNTPHYETSNDYSDLFVGNIFSEIQKEINNTYIIQGTSEEASIKCSPEKITGNDNKYSSCNDTNNNNNNNNGNNNHNNTYICNYNNLNTNLNKKAIHSNVINIEEYVNFIKAKQNEYKKKKKDYIIAYINKRKIRKFHYEDMQNLFKRYLLFLNFQEKCLFCNNYLSFSFLYFNKYIKKKRKNIDTYKKNNKKLLYFCECLENIEYSKQHINDKDDDGYIDMIHLTENTFFSINTPSKYNTIRRDFMKKIKYTKIFKHNYVNKKIYKTVPIKKIENIDTTYINKFKCIKEPQLTIEHVKKLNSNTEIFTPLFKIQNVCMTLTTVEINLLIACLKVVNKIVCVDRTDTFTIIIFCYLSNLYNIVMRLNAECVLSCYSQTHLEHFLY